MYAIAFNKKSLGVSIFLMAFMLHPCVSIPMAVVAEWPRKFCSFLCIKKSRNDNDSFCLKLKEKILSFTMLLYLGVIGTSQFYLNIQWNSFREHAIDEKFKNVTLQNITRKQTENAFITRHQYGSKLYDQCNCDTNDKFDCVKLDIGQENIEDALPIDIYNMLLVNVTLMLAFYLIEAFAFPLPTISMYEFLIVPSLLLNETEEGHKKEIFELHQEKLTGVPKINESSEQNTNSQKKSKKASLYAKSCTKNSISFIVVIIFVTFMCSSGLMYQQVHEKFNLYDWSFKCDDESYNVGTPQILKCEGKLNFSQLFFRIYMILTLIPNVHILHLQDQVYMVMKILGHIFTAGFIEIFNFFLLKISN